MSTKKIAILFGMENTFPPALVNKINSMKVEGVAAEFVHTWMMQLTGQRLTAHYRALEKSGRKDHREGEGLSARTVRYLHTIIHGVLGQAVRDGLLARNPADAATPPTAKEAKAPEMHPWDAGQLAAFLGWAQENSQNSNGSLQTWNSQQHDG